MAISKLEVKTGAIPGRGDDYVKVNDVDVTKYISGVTIETNAGQVNEFALRLYAGMHLEMDGIVYAVMPESDAQVLRRATSFIDGLNPEAVEQAALEGLSYGDGSIVHSVLRVIKEVLTDAANELEATSELPGVADDGRPEDLTTDEDF